MGSCINTCYIIIIIMKKHGGLFALFHIFLDNSKHKSIKVTVNQYSYLTILQKTVLDICKSFPVFVIDIIIIVVIIIVCSVTK